MFLQMSVTAGILVVLIFILRFLFREKLPKVTFLLLWVIVLARLLIPASFYTAFSFQNVAQPVVEVMPTLEGVSESLVLRDLPVIFDHIPVASTFSFDWFIFLVVTWGIGAFMMTLHFVRVYWKLHQRLRFALQVKDHPVINKWQATCQLSRKITIKVSDGIKTPLTIGIIRPKIYLPKEMDWADNEQMLYILTHEFYHIKRFDALWKLIALVALCMHWFNPFVWVMCVLGNRDLEVTCDAWVVKKFGIGVKKNYAFTLIEMAQKQREFAPNQTMVLGSGFARNATDERIKAIMKSGKLSLVSVLIAMLVIPIFALSAFARSRSIEPVVNEQYDDQRIEIPYVAIHELMPEVEMNAVEWHVEEPDVDFSGSKSIDGWNFVWNGSEWESVGWDGMVVGVNTDPSQGHSVGIQAMLEQFGTYWEDAIVLSTEGVPGSRFYDIHYSEMWEVETVRGERYVITSWRSTNPTYPHAYEIRVFSS